jgi:short chain dehydrogenase
MSSAHAPRRQRRIQEQVARADKARPKQEPKQAMQAGARKYPAPPFPKQHQSKPGSESSLNPAPLYDAPFYVGSRKLDKKVALITGGDSGIGRAVAILFAREGADVAIPYLSEHRDARNTKEKVEAEGRRCLLIAGDVSSQKFYDKAVAQTVKAFGRLELDVLVNNAAFQVHTSRFEDLTARHFDETLKTNLYGYFYMAQAAVKHMKQGSAIVNTGSVTAGSWHR